jgi:hypothetical protein
MATTNPITDEKVVSPVIRWMLRRICRKLVVQGPLHAKRITEYYRIMGEAAEAEFTEDNELTLVSFLRECWSNATITGRVTKGREAALLADIDSAMKANNMSNDLAFKKDLCQCDASVGWCPCPYCAIHDVLRRCREYVLERIR